MKLTKIMLLGTILFAFLNTTLFAVDPVQKGSMQLNLELADPAGTDTVTDTVELKHIQASEVEPFIKARLSRYGTVQVNDALNMLIITDMDNKVKDLIKIVKKLDSPKLKDYLRLDTVVLSIKNTQAYKLINLIRDKLSSSAIVRVDGDLNALIITDLKSKIDNAKAFVAKLDVPVKQVSIEMKVVELNNGSDSKLGFDWRSILKSAQATINSLSTRQSQPFTADVDSPNVQKNSLDSKAQYTNIGYGYKGSMSIQGLDSLIGLLVSNGRGQVLSSPRIVASNNKRAYISDGDRIYYENLGRHYYTGNYSSNYPHEYGSVSARMENEIPSTNISKSYDNNSTDSITQNMDTSQSTTWVNAGFSLSVIPHIVSQDFVTLDLNAHLNNLTGWSPTNSPIVSSRSANSTVTIKSGEVFVMGGLKKETTVTQVDRVPVLGYIPLIDFFFSSRKEIRVRNDVVIFIIPTILEKTGVNNTPEDQHLLDKAMGQGGTKDKKM